MKTLRYVFLLVIGISFLVMGSAIGFAQEGDDGMTMDPAMVERGREVFVANGCTACHGQDAEGTDIAPALAGHTEFQVRRQVRSPIGIMLVFSPAQIPAEDLDALVAYILSLEEMAMEGDGGHDMHDMSGIAVGDIVFGHHWLLWLELEAGDIEGAIHHTAHILELVEGVHLATMQPVLTALGEGDLEAAQAVVEPMITDVGDFSHDSYVIGRQLVYLAVTASDQEVAHHFALDLTQHEFSDEQMTVANEVLEHIEACDLNGAAMMIEMELGEDVNFIPAGMGMDMDADADHEEGDADADHEEGDADADHEEGDADMDMDADADHEEGDADADHEEGDADMDMDADADHEESTGCGDAEQMDMETNEDTDSD